MKDREAWGAAVCGVTKSRTQLSDWTTRCSLRGNSCCKGLVWKSSPCQGPEAAIYIGWLWGPRFRSVPTPIFYALSRSSAVLSQCSGLSLSRTAEGLNTSLITKASRPERPLPTKTAAAAAALANNCVKFYGCSWSNPRAKWVQSLWGIFSSVQFSSFAQLCPTLCDPMNRSTQGLPVHHQLPEFTQTHVHRVSDAIQPSPPLSSPSPPAPNPSQHQGLFQWVNSSHEVAKVLEFQL